MKKRTSYDDVTEALRVVRAWYYDEIRSLADEVRDACKTGDLENDDDVTRWIDETLGGHEFVIYTFKAKLVLIASDNEDEGEDAGAETPEDRAFYAMRADLIAEIGDYDLFAARER